MFLQSCRQFCLQYCLQSCLQSFFQSRIPVFNFLMRMRKLAWEDCGCIGDRLYSSIMETDLFLAKITNRQSTQTNFDINCHAVLLMRLKRVTDIDWTPTVTVPDVTNSVCPVR